MFDDAFMLQILYISNLVPGQLSLPSENSEYVPNGEAGLGCEIQTWYLANDMQLFLLTPIVVSRRDTAGIWVAFFQECQR